MLPSIRNTFRTSFAVIATLLSLAIPTSAFATVSVTGSVTVSADTAADATTPAFTNLVVTFTEGAGGDFPVQSAKTIILDAPAGWAFNTSGASATDTTPGGNVNVNTITSTATTVTVTVNVANTNKVDVLQITVPIRPANGLGIPGTGNVTYDAASTVTFTGAPAGGATVATASKSVGAAKKLAVNTQPAATATAGVAFTTQPAIAVQDQFGNVRTADNATIITAARDGVGSATLQGTLTATAASGVATFANLSYNKAEAMNIQFTSGVLTTATSNNVVVSAAAPSKLLFTTSPAGATAGAPFTTQPTVVTTDTFGNVTNAGLAASVPITFSISSGLGTLQGTTTADIGSGAGNGTVTTANLQINSSGSKTLGVTGLGSAVSSSFTVSPAAADHLTLMTQPPGNATAGLAFSPATVAEIHDAFENLRTTDTTAVTATRHTGTASLLGTTVVNAVGGVATFSNLIYDKAESITIDFTAPGLAGPTSDPTVVAPAAAHHLTITTQPPATSVAGVTFTPSPTVEIRDQFENLRTTDTSSVTAARSGGLGTLQGTTSVNAAGGIATFSNINHAVANTITVAFSLSGVTGATTGSIVITPATASQLVFVTQPSGATAGAAFTTQPVIHTRDAFGNDSLIGLAASVPLTVTLSAGNGTLAGTTSYDIGTGAGNGTIATAGLRIDTVGVTALEKNKQLTVSAGGSPADGVSTTFTVAPGAANRLAMLTQTPATATAGVAFTPAPQVRIEDAFGNLRAADTTSITAARGNHGTATLQGTLTLAAVAGVATFNSVNYQKAEAMNVAFTASGLTGVTSNDVAVSPAAATHLGIVTQPPATATAGVVFSPNPVVSILDTFNNVVTGDSTTSVTAARGATGTATLQGTLSAVASSGIVTFTNLSYNKAETMNLAFSAGGLTGIASNNVLVSPAAAATFAVTAPASSTAGTGFSATVTAKDAFNNTVTAYSGTVHFTSSDPQAVLPSNATLASGTGTFPVTLKTAGSQSVVATDTVSLTVTGSANVTVAATTATKLTFTTQPGGATAGSAFGTQPVARSQDAFGNNSIVGISNNQQLTIALTSGTGTLLGTATINIGNNGPVPGTATFTNLEIDTAGAKALTATTSGFTSAISNSFTVSPTTATKLVFATQPTTTTAGATITPSPIVESQDPFNNISTVGLGSSKTVTLGVASGTGTIGGTLAYDLVANAGTVTFTGLSMTVSGAKTFNATATGLTTATSSSFTINPAAADHLTIQTQTPATATAGVSFSPAPVVRIEDVFGNLRSADTTTITAARGNHGTASLNGTTSVAAVAGVATFSAINYQKAETMNVAFSAAGVTGITSNDVMVSPAAASKLTIATQPSATATAGANFAQQPVIRIEDTFGNLRTGDTTLITATRSAGSGTLQGTTAINAVAGVATYTNLHHNVSGTITIAFAAAGLTGATSTNVVVSPAATSQLVITGAPGTSVAGTPFTVTVTAQDSFGNTTPAYAQTVSFTTSDSGVSTITPNAFNFTGQNGTHTFTNGVTLTQVGTQTLSVSDGTITSSSASISVTPAAATKLVFFTQPGNATAGAVFGTQPVIRTRDVYDNDSTVGLANKQTFTIALSTGTGPLQGTISGNSVDIGTHGGNGTFAFTDLRIDNASDAKQLTVAASGFTSATSNSFNVSPAATSTLTVTAPATSVAGNAFSVTVTAKDPFANTTPAYSGTVHFTSNDGVAVLPSNSTLTSGTGTFSATLKTTGAHTVVGTDTVTPSITGTATVTVSAAAPATVAKTAGDGQTAAAGSSRTATVHVTDAFGNAVPSTSVTFAITAGSGTVNAGSNATVSTNASGDVSVTWIFGPVAGSNTMSVTVGAASATFTGTGTCTYTTKASGLWSSPTTWIGECVPAIANAVTISSGHNVSVTSNAQAASLTFAAASADSNLNIASGITLDVAGAVTMSVPAANQTGEFLNVGAGTLNAGSVTLNGSGGQKETDLTVSTGTINVSGDIAFPGNPPTQKLTSTGAAHINVGGNFNTGGSLTFDPATTLTFNGAGAQSIGTYNPNNAFPITVVNNASGTVTMAGNLSIAGNFTITSGAFNAAAGQLTLNQNFTDNASFTSAGTVLFNGTTAQTIAGSTTPETFTGVTMNNAAGLTLAKNVTVNGALTLTLGNITTGANTLSISSTGSVAHTSGHVIGNLQKTFTASASTVFEVGTANGYSPATVSATAGSYPATVTVKATQGAHPNAPSAGTLQRYWTVTSNGVATADLLLHYFLSDVVGTESLYKFGNFNAGVWSYPATGSVDILNHVGNATGLTQFGDFTLTEKATNLAISSVNGGLNPIAGTPFSVVVRSTSGDGSPAVVSTNTTVQLSLGNGTGLLGGTLTGIIPAGQSTVTISGVTYTKAESGVVLGVTATSGDTLIAGASAPFTVDPGATHHFAVSAPASTNAGTSISFTVIAQDALNNTTPAYSGTVGFTSSDAAATLPIASTLTNGAGTFGATLNTSGSRTITGTDASITGHATVLVNAGTLHHFAVTAPASSIAGASVSVTVTAQDSLNNTVSTYAGTVTFTSNDAMATLPAPSTLTSGTGTFSVTFKTAGNDAIHATDGAITGAATVAVSPAATDHLVVTAPASTPAGTPVSVTVTAFDIWNNVTPGYTGTVHFTSTDGSATLPANYTFAGADAGAHTFSATLISAGSRSITATDTTTASIHGSASITVTAGPLDHFLVEQASGGAIPSQIAGVPFNIRISARDTQNNIPNFTGTVTITSSGNLATGGGTSPAFVAGVLSSQAINISNAGNFTITATDTGSSATGTSNTFAVGGGIDLVTTIGGTSNALPGTNATYVITVTNSGTASAPNAGVTLASPAGWTPTVSGACASFPCSLGTLAVNQTATINVSLAIPFGAGSGIPYAITAAATTSGIEVVTNNNSATQLTTVPIVACGTAVTNMLPFNNSTNVPLNVTLSWQAGNADSYQLYLGKQGGGCSTLVATTSSTTYAAHLQAGQNYEWHVVALRAGCPPVASACVRFSTATTCEAVEPTIRAVAEITTGAHYHVAWTDLGSTQYELQESADDAFTAPTSTRTGSLSQMFSHDVTAATAFFYRVRSVTATCAGLTPNFSPTVRVIVQPHGNPNSSSFDLVIERGNDDSIPQNAHISGQPGALGIDANGATDYVATSDQPWLTVAPSSGSIPPAGTDLTLNANAKGLAAGTTIAMVRLATAGGTPIQTVKVALNVAEPMSEGGKDAPPSNASIIPGVAHAPGLNAQWQSDVRIYNPGSKSATCALLFTPTAQDGTVKGRRITIAIASHATVALDDVVRHEFGYGVMGESATGALEIRPLDASDKAIVTSRTYNLAPNGTYGQYIPAFAATQFAKVGDVMSLQQVAQSDAYRTNVGFVDASGLGARLNVRIFDDSGNQLTAFDTQLKPFEQTQMDSLLGAKKITANDARIEVEVMSTDSRVMSYASVVDNKTSDPLLVTPAIPAKVSETRYVIPGVADFTTITNTWRSDVRIYNSSRASAAATVTFYPGSGDPVSKTITIAPGEVKAYDGVLASLFGITNNGGAMHVSTTTQSSLVVTARTYDAHGNGTYGQFIPALTSSDGTSLGNRTLEILSVEQSDLYRANIGVLEIAGRSADVAITATLPDGRNATQTVSLAPYQFVQFSSLVRALGFDSATNVRVSIAVTAGQGRVAGYASVIDNRTQDPTYIPAQ
jgi:hypothetical protein